MKFNPMSCACKGILCITFHSGIVINMCHVTFLVLPHGWPKCPEDRKLVFIRFAYVYRSDVCIYNATYVYVHVLDASYASLFFNVIDRHQSSTVLQTVSSTTGIIDSSTSERHIFESQKRCFTQGNWQCFCTPRQHKVILRHRHCHKTDTKS